MSLALAAAVLAAAQAVPVPPDYRDPANWLCLPGREDVCAWPVTAHELRPSGWGNPVTTLPDPRAPVDCFYVYPTVSRDSGMNSDMTPSRSEEILFAQQQFARFASVCRPFAPVYRQMTVTAIALAATGADMTPYGAIAYGDVRAAFREYLKTHNKGRPFVLIGHSQGSIMLEQLIREEIEGSDAQDLLLRAILPGWNIMVPEGEVVGGSFTSVPGCTSAAQTGCVMSWSTFGAGDAPGAGALFGYSQVTGLRPLCTVPADRPADGGWTSLDGFWFARSRYPVKGGPIRWSAEGPPPGPFATSDDLVEARCISAGRRGYLEVRATARGAGDSRTDRIGGEPGMGGFFFPGWGKHLADIAIAQDELIRLVDRLGRQQQASAAGRR
ncbi:DUF3089 domain-containing protein [Sphingomicrobium astaxanthinifaciens]|uniref:DUF3089 domain-containing protein n=1 Tax=Sphingomicrobium astaxanthinifaciens TaxID=1227949 RepID=UPI001FCBAC0E|nr:DUF3089 domain-containing protein [Sphingomicrobium astaxanthinifaciens]MCJ7420893.1 DUF3089 domain-containing protein [Sphingomicrobium astaxanthinifaciens]